MVVVAVDLKVFLLGKMAAPAEEAGELVAQAAQATYLQHRHRKEITEEMDLLLLFLMAVAAAVALVRMAGLMQILMQAKAGMVWPPVFLEAA
jgi:hypothetical protein